MQMSYMNYKNFSVLYDPEKFSFQCLYRTNSGETREQVFLEGHTEMINGEAIPAQPKTDMTHTYDEYCYVYQYANGCTLSFILNNHEIAIRFRGLAVLKGYFRWGVNPSENTFAGLYDSPDHILNTASGPVTRAGDDMLFDREKDALLHFVPNGKLALNFDWAQQKYAFTLEAKEDLPETEIKLRIEEDYMARKFNIPYKPIDKHSWFAVPPVSWMTWYACGTADFQSGEAVDNDIVFEANEAVVLENTKQMKQKLGAYCKDLVTWVDWEWDHRNFSGKNDDCDALTPRSDAYPNGMKYVSDKIKSLGCIPAIWTGMTCDGRLNKWFKEHRECVLGPNPTWCAQWYLDPGYPEVFTEYVPMVMNQLKEWGYAGVKWDCIYTLLPIWNLHRDELKDPGMDYWTAMRRFAEAGRKALGDDIFFYYCNMSSEAHISSGCGYVNSARIGSDIFKWEEFIERAMDTLLHYYPLHNTVMYADCDNIVLRKQFNTLEQARTRVSFYGLSGVPVTIGDCFKEYDPERLDMLRRIVPVVDMHPTELQSKKANNTLNMIVSNFSRSFGSWQVAGIMNTAETEQEFILDFAKECRLAAGSGEKYAVYDYWKQKFLGVFDRSVTLRIPACGTAVLRITPVTDTALPVLISSSRHITQGGYELIDLKKDFAERKISGTVKCIGSETEKLTFLLPENTKFEVCGGNWTQDGNCGILSITLPENQDAAWSLQAE